MKRNGAFFNTLIWAGAGFSIAEILTGTYFAPLGFLKGLIAIILGHIVGGALMFFAGFIGAKSNKNAMQTTSMSFGKSGAKFFAALNIVQLVGWTGIMIYDCSLSANKLLTIGRGYWCLVIGVLVIFWLIVKGDELGILNAIAIFALFSLSILLYIKVFVHGDTLIESNIQADDLKFIQAFELSIAMPLSWLPLISDYTSNATKPFLVTLLSVIVYNIVSILMYLIGMLLAIYTSESDIANIVSSFGGWTGIAGLCVIVLSTVTTTYLDAFSLGISSKSIYESKKEKWISVIATLLATILAIVYNMDNITDFLYIIGSVFAPMIAVQIADYFVLKNTSSLFGFNWRNLFAWLTGFWVSRTMLTTSFILGSIIPSMLVTFVLVIILDKIENKISFENYDMQNKR